MSRPDLLPLRSAQQRSQRGSLRRGIVAMVPVLVPAVVAVFVALGSLFGADVARADPAIDEALSIVDDALWAIDMQDGAALEDAVTRATTTGSWLPSITVESMQAGDRDALVLIWLGLYLPSGEAFLVASDVVEMELGARRWGLPDDPDSEAAIDELDRHASALLEIFDHRGLPLTTASRTVMARNSTPPEFETFDTAIADLLAQAELDPPDDWFTDEPPIDDWVPPPMSVPVDDGVVPTPTVATVPPTAVVTVPPATAPPVTAPAQTAPPATAPAVAAPSTDVAGSDPSAVTSDDAAAGDPTETEPPPRVEVPPENFDDVDEVGRAESMSVDATDETNGQPTDPVDDDATNVAPDGDEVTSENADTVNDTVNDTASDTANETENDSGADTEGDGESDGSPVSSSAMIALAAIALLAVFMSAISMVRSRRHAHLSAIAYSDALTGLNNRRRFDADVSAMSSRGSAPTAMLMLDVDHFKQFNDTFGHAVGDDVLRRVGDVFSRTVRANDVAYRYGGEEFCALLPDTTEAEAMAIAERVRLAIEAIEMRLDDDSTVSVTASVGVSCGPAQQLEGLVRRADEAVYRAKDDGRNRVVAG